MLCARMKHPAFHISVVLLTKKSPFAEGHIAMVVQGASAAGTEEECLILPEL